MKHALISKALLVLMLFLVISTSFPVNAQTTDDDNEDEQITDDDHDEEDEPEYERDDDGTVWIQTEIMTVMLDPKIPAYQYWYTPDENGSLARFSVSYPMVIEFEDYNGDGVYQINETLQFAPLEAFDWNLITGSVIDTAGHNSEVYASYVKGGLTGEDWNDDWFENWMPGYSGEDGEDTLNLADDDDNSTEDEEDDYETLNLEQFESMTMQFYAHIYMDDYNGTVNDDEGVKAEYTVAAGVELKIDIEIGNFPYLSDTSKVAVLNYLQEDLASEGKNHIFELNEDDQDHEIESEDEWEINDDLGEKFNDIDDNDDGNENDVQGLSLLEASTNTTRGFYRWLDKAVQTLPNGTSEAVDVEASYWADGSALLLFFAYPNFDGGSVLHDPSLKLIETSSPVPILPGSLEVPIEITMSVIIGIFAIALIGIAIKKR
ncbi:MAG: hypothetical protein ACFFEJ_02690 [Candidatus Thorarchaeota archaeon]